MKQPENNEIESLLRGLARGKSLPEPGVVKLGAHLDADELNSYAEGALPEMARARYTSHLADCDACRKIVTQLALAAGPPITATPTSQPVSGSGWRQALAAFFSPASLRYAIPALALIVVGVIFFSSRSARYDSMEARNDGPAELSTASPANASARAQSDQTAAPATGEQPQKTMAPNAAAPAKSEEKAGKADNAKSEASSGSGQGVPAGEVASVNQPAYAPEPAPPPPVASTTAPAKAKEKEAAAREVADMKTAAARKKKADKQPEDIKDDEGDQASSAGASGSGARSRDDASKPASAVGSLSRAERNEAVETRTVNGRRFQRHNGIWVDSTFSSSLSITLVARGSEQYRALIADEPGIDSLARQLGGEVLLVWKGRAYRVR